MFHANFSMNNALGTIVPVGDLDQDAVDRIWTLFKSGGKFWFSGKNGRGKMIDLSQVMTVDILPQD